MIHLSLVTGLDTEPSGTLNSKERTDFLNYKSFFFSSNTLKAPGSSVEKKSILQDRRDNYYNNKSTQSTRTKEDKTIHLVGVLFLLACLKRK